MTSVNIIDNRLNLVETFLCNVTLRESVVRLLQKSHDSQRIVQKFSLGRGDADDLVALAATIEVTRGIQELLKNSLSSIGETNNTRPHRESMKALLAKLDIPQELAKRIAESIDEEGLIQRQRMEESEAAEMIAMAQAVISGEKIEREKSKTKTTKKTVTTTTKKSRRMLSAKDAEKQEAWVMQKRFDKNHSLAGQRIKRKKPDLSHFIVSNCLFIIVRSGGLSPIPASFRDNLVHHDSFGNSTISWKSWNKKRKNSRRICVTPLVAVNIPFVISLKTFTY